MQEKHSISVVLLVIGTMAGVVWLYAMCLFIICVWSGKTDMGVEALKQFKDFGVFAAGALSGFLARTSITKGDEETATPVEVKNTEAEPVPTAPQANNEKPKDQVNP